MFYVTPVADTTSVISPKMLSTFQYKTPPVKLHHRIRMTIKVHSNSDKIDEFMSEAPDVMEFVDEVLSDPIDYLPEMMKYNARLNLKSKSGRFKIFFGSEIAPGDKQKGTKYMGVKVKF